MVPMLLWFGMAWAGDLVLSTDKPVAGQAVVVTVDPGTTVTVTLRPGSAIEVVAPLAVDAAGKGEWTPSDAGLAVLAWDGAAGKGSRRVAVRFATVPLSGLAVFLIAGTLLFGGIGYSYWRLMRGAAEGLPVAVPMDT